MLYRHYDLQLTEVKWQLLVRKLQETKTGKTPRPRIKYNFKATVIDL